MQLTGDLQRGGIGLLVYCLLNDLVGQDRTDELSKIENFNDQTLQTPNSTANLKQSKNQHLGSEKRQAPKLEPYNLNAALIYLEKLYLEKLYLSEVYQKQIHALLKLCIQRTPKG